MAFARRLRLDTSLSPTTACLVSPTSLHVSLSDRRGWRSGVVVLLSASSQNLLDLELRISYAENAADFRCPDRLVYKLYDNDTVLLLLTISLFTTHRHHFNQIIGRLTRYSRLNIPTAHYPQVSMQQSVLPNPLPSFSPHISILLPLEVIPLPAIDRLHEHRDGAKYG